MIHYHLAHYENGCVLSGNPRHWILPWPLFEWGRHALFFYPLKKHSFPLETFRTSLDPAAMLMAPKDIICLWDSYMLITIPNLSILAHGCLPCQWIPSPLVARHWKLPPNPVIWVANNEYVWSTAANLGQPFPHPRQIRKPNQAAMSAFPPSFTYSPHPVSKLSQPRLNPLADVVI